MHNIRLGLGLIGIGREWGNIPSPIPTEEEVLKFLHAAYELGIDFYDTAPAYGLSEERFGKFLRTLSPKDVDNITVATKFGEHWNPKTNSTYTDHSFESLRESIENSLSKLGKIDIIQLHKANPNVLKNDSLYKALEYAKKLGISSFGASISDIDSGLIVCESKSLEAIQLPFNAENSTLEKVLMLASKKGKLIIINRPFNMGKILYPDIPVNDKSIISIMAFKYILDKDFHGVILTGTKSQKHLQENLLAFKEAESILVNKL